MEVGDELGGCYTVSGDIIVSGLSRNAEEGTESILKHHSASVGPYLLLSLLCQVAWRASIMGGAGKRSEGGREKPGYLLHSVARL